VVAPPPSPTPTPTPVTSSSSLANTGDDSAWLLEAGLGLLVAGAVSTVAGRERRRIRRVH
jgi:LPXTG-motif cell wall-anchored protein